MNPEELEEALAIVSGSQGRDVYAVLRYIPTFDGNWIEVFVRGRLEKDRGDNGKMLVLKEEKSGRVHIIPASQIMAIHVEGDGTCHGDENPVTVEEVSPYI